MEIYKNYTKLNDDMLKGLFVPRGNWHVNGEKAMNLFDVVTIVA